MTQQEDILDDLKAINSIEATIANLLTPEPDLHLVDRQDFGIALAWLAKQRAKLYEQLRD